MAKRVVVIGGSAAGMSAASVAKRRDPDLIVTVLEQGSAISYSACGIPYRLGGEIERPMKDLVVLTPEEAITRKGVDVRTRTRATRVEPKAKKVHWKDLESGKSGSDEYDVLVLAMGSRPKPAIPLAPGRGVFCLHTLDDGIALERWLDAKHVKTAVIVGGGFIGVETTEAFLKRGLDVTLLNPSDHVLRNMLDPAMSAKVVEKIKSSRAQFVDGVRATGWRDQDGNVHLSKQMQTEASPTGPASGQEKKTVSAQAQQASPAAAPKTGKPGSGKGSPAGTVQDEKRPEKAPVDPAGPPVAAVLADGQEHPADVVVVATGIRPETELARQVGCRLRDDGAILVDAKMRTGIEDVWACGDLVAVEHKITRAPVVVPLALHSNRAGRIAGTNLTGGDLSFPGVLGTAITRFEELEVASTGITETQASRLDMDVVVGDVQAQTRAGYLPTVGTVDVRMVADLSTGRLLGVQMVGGPGTALRIDAAAAMVWMGATLEEVEAMDLAYNPPFSPVWDPLAIAARLTEKKRVPAGL